MNSYVVRRPTTIAVASGKGGVGKSTVALNLAICLASSGLSTGLLDADVYGPDLPRMLNLSRTERAAHVTLAQHPKAVRLMEPIFVHGVQLMSVALMIADDQSLDWSSPLIGLLVRRLATEVGWKDLDTLVLDLPPGTADLQQEVLREFRPDGVLLVVTPQDVAHLDGKRVVEMCAKEGVPILGGVANMEGLRCPSCDCRIQLFPDVIDKRSVWSAGITKLASLEFDVSVAIAAEAGRPIVIDKPRSKTAAEYRRLARRVVRMVT
jgi:ATP-binding protein involved in chromosome partitioning